VNECTKASFCERTCTGSANGSSADSANGSSADSANGSAVDSRTRIFAVRRTALSWSRLSCAVQAGKGVVAS